MRYPGQAHDLPIQAGDGGALDEAACVEAFHAAHERIYGFREAGSAVEVMNVRLAAIGRLAPVNLPLAAPAAAGPATETRVVALEGIGAVPVHPRSAFGPGSVLDGPAIIEQPDTTTLVLPGWRITCDALGSLLLDRSAP
jgi:N-methylhydantoinase A